MNSLYIIIFLSLSLCEPVEVQGARGFMVSGILMCGIAVMVAAVGMKCTTCLSDDMALKNKVALGGGVVFIIAGVWLPLLYACWQDAAQLQIRQDSKIVIVLYTIIIIIIISF